jgi:hypothetical protein
MFPIFLDMPPFLLVMLQVFLKRPVPIKAFVPLIISYTHESWKGGLRREGFGRRYRECNPT